MHNNKIKEMRLRALFINGVMFHLEIGDLG